MAGDRKAYYAKYYLERKDEIREKQKKYRAENIEAIKYRRHIAYMAQREKKIRQQIEYQKKKRASTIYPYPHLLEMREKVPTNRGKYEFDKNRGKRKESMREHCMNRWKKILKKKKYKNDYVKYKKLNLVDEFKKYKQN